MVSEKLFTSNKSEWETPPELFNLLDSEFHFTLDVCATKENTKCEKFYTKNYNGLDKPWENNVCWMNPPYGKEIGAWVERAYMSTALVVCLLPARVDTKWWYQFCAKADEVRFLKGRLKFVGAKSSAPFPSAIVIFDNFPRMRMLAGVEVRPGMTSWWDWKKELECQ